MILDLSTCNGFGKDRVPRIFKKAPNFVNVAKTLAQTLKVKFKFQNMYIQLLLNVYINTTNHVLKLLMCLKMEKVLK
jgi:hypothetical protein